MSTRDIGTKAGASPVPATFSFFSFSFLRECIPIGMEPFRTRATFKRIGLGNLPVRLVVRSIAVAPRQTVAGAGSVTPPVVKTARMENMFEVQCGVPEAFHVST